MNFWIGIFLKFLGLVQYIFLRIFLSPIIWLITHIAFYLIDFFKWLFIKLCDFIEWFFPKLFNLIKLGFQKLISCFSRKSTI